jgi:hypothetical protein
LKRETGASFPANQVERKAHPKDADQKLANFWGHVEIRPEHQANLLAHCH